MIGFLRCVGLLNAAVWFGAAIFFTFAAGPAAFSQDMKELLGPKFYPYFSGAIAQILIARYFHWQLACGLVAAAHLAAESLYFGTPPRKISYGLLAGLLSLTLLGGYWLQPKLKRLHATKYSVSASPENRELASQSFRAWHGLSQVGNLFMIVGLGVYLWRVGHPGESARFVSGAKFRG